MSDEIKKCLQDFLDSINSIFEYIGDIKLFEKYEKNKFLRHAVEREIEIIGEAINRIKQFENEIDINNAKQIIATRNIIAHAYDAVNNSIIWGNCRQSFTKLKNEIQDLLNSSN